MKKEEVSQKHNKTPYHSYQETKMLEWQYKATTKMVNYRQNLARDVKMKRITSFTNLRSMKVAIRHHISTTYN